ncbi:hypothetical protein ZWY2020_003649 [Hordeum vulgare]|nr:hypothetical protein ZWY2020_003649 [Hordeum vulgare]
MEVNKGRNITQIGGDEWDRFIARTHLTRGELISFSFTRETPRLVVIYLNSEMVRLSEDETDNLLEKLLPRDAYVGMPFMTRLTHTSVTRHIMLCVSYGIEPHEAGIAGLHLVTRGSITTCPYIMDTDGRTIFNAAGWSNFLASKNLWVGQVVLVSIRNTQHHDMRMMIVIDLL